jgi:hypothetical protein
MKISKKTSCDGCLALSGACSCVLGYNLERYESPTSDEDKWCYPLEECPKPMIQDKVIVAKKTIMKTNSNLQRA